MRRAPRVLRCLPNILAPGGAGPYRPGRLPLLNHEAPDRTHSIAGQRFTLDQVAPNHPAKLELWTGHGMYFNTKGLQDLHIPENASDPFGGFYERFPGTGVLNGVVHEYAEHLVRRRFAERLTDAQIAGIYQNFVQAALSFGFTSVQEMSIGLPHERSVRILGQVNPAIRWRSICIPLTPDEPCHMGASSAPLVTPSGIKWIADGTPIERLAFMSEPYQDRPDTRGRFNFPADAFTHLVERSLFAPLRKGQLLLHLVGDAAIGTLLDEMEELAPAAHWRQVVWEGWEPRGSPPIPISPGLRPEADALGKQARCSHAA